MLATVGISSVMCRNFNKHNGNAQERITTRKALRDVSEHLTLSQNE